MAACLAAWRGQVEALAEAKAVAVHCLQRCMHNMLVRLYPNQGRGCGFLLRFTAKKLSGCQMQ